MPMDYNYKYGISVARSPSRARSGICIRRMYGVEWQRAVPFMRPGICVMRIRPAGSAVFSVPVLMPLTKRCCEINLLRDSMVSGRIMRAVKVARRRRDLSPDQYYYALHAALQMVLFKGYQLRTTVFRGCPSLRIVVLLRRTAALDDAVAIVLRELEEFGNVQLFVTHRSRAFYRMCSCDVVN
jgi:hypothetical protein